MRILLGAKHAPNGSRQIGGVQSWCRTVAKELQRRGHEAVTWGPEQPRPRGEFDLGIMANAGDTSTAWAQCHDVINVSHGIIPPERPANSRAVFTSEEVRGYWMGNGPVIRQPIDMDYWSPNKAERTYLTRFSYRNGLAFVPELARHMGLTYRKVHNLSQTEAREVIRKSACVLATGRAALEAMACDVPVVLADHRAAYQGPLMDLDLDHAMKRNYSGRGGKVPSRKSVRVAIEEAVARVGWRDRVREYHRVELIVDQLLEEME